MPSPAKSLLQSFLESWVEEERILKYRILGPKINSCMSEPIIRVSHTHVRL